MIIIKTKDILPLALMKLIFALLFKLFVFYYRFLRR